VENSAAVADSGRADYQRDSNTEDEAGALGDAGSSRVVTTRARARRRENPTAEYVPGGAEAPRRLTPLCRVDGTRRALAVAASGRPDLFGVNQGRRSHRSNVGAMSEQSRSRRGQAGSGPVEMSRASQAAVIKYRTWVTLK